ncbi:LPS-assembly protein LptD [Acinetobacter shaoyimingii]|uniref:LPS-assembly protein LptD n=1 Tax=Acinetobacter shaoyimingii TaxID=2715164 RepID=A0A6G8RWG2_9GAMM|nr:LPS assembly protein LptD [Acinetobacter shaoyimingii]NHB57200.1 LPS-assembly protein LptD [Acinetobacter shaoyimingii]QIO06191.1 LPS-assembly protein LptD [Acinetobacter shaoyimingii]
MKHQFNFNPLAAAILSFLCGSTVSSYAESNTSVSDIDNKQLKASLKESYPGQNFFEQYYVDKDSPEARQRDTKVPGAQFCQNTFVTPISPNTKALNPDEATSVLTAEHAYYNPNGDTVLEGNVIIDQDGRMVRANHLTMDKTQTFAKASGNVQMAQAGLISQSDKVNYNLKTQTGDLTDSYYIAEQARAHGHADLISRTSPDVLLLKNASYTTCPPDEKPTWKIEAREIELNQETGRGKTKGAKVKIKDHTIATVPYFNFPIDDRRVTGILTPSLAYTNNGGLQLSVPIYLNLAPNYDATVTPRYMGDRGAMAEAEFRFMTENFGSGNIRGAYLPSDEKYNNEDRKDFHFLYDWQINNQWSTNIDYNYVSDKDFFNDLDTNPNTRTRLNQRQAWELNYQNGLPGLKAKLKIEDFQTLDPLTPYKDRPYARLPQLLVNYVTGDAHGLEFEFNNDTAYFKKDFDSQANISQPSGVRLYNQFAARYNFRNPWGFAIPEVSVRSLNTYYDQDTRDNANFNSDSENKSVVVPQFTLDTGLTFEREGKFLQTLSPRAFYAYSPYRQQNGYPNFDTISASLNYDQLFSPYRFYGHDRLDDNNFLSLGLSYSLFDTIGLERLRASVGKSYFFDDRRVTLNDSQNSRTSTEDDTGPVVSLSSQLSENYTIRANSYWMSNGDNAQRDIQLYYTGDKGNLYNFGYFKRSYLEDRQDRYDQVTASFIQPIKNNWRMMGHVQYDMDNNVAREYLLGLNYESCCWGVSVYGRSYYNDLDNVNDSGVKAKRAVMAEFTLKGLGGLNSKLSSFLEDRVLGYDKVNQNWTN